MAWTDAARKAAAATRAAHKRQSVKAKSVGKFLASFKKAGNPAVGKPTQTTYATNRNRAKAQLAVAHARLRLLNN